MHEVIIEIDAEGNTQIQVKGVKGKKCFDLTKELEKALGSVTDSNTTKEYYERESTNESIINNERR